jgi:hypothetical protein
MRGKVKENVRILSIFKEYKAIYFVLIGFSVDLGINIFVTQPRTVFSTIEAVQTLER